MISFIGVLIMIVFSTENTSENETSDKSLFMFIFSIILAIISSILVGAINVVIKKMKGIHPSVISGF